MSIIHLRPITMNDAPRMAELINNRKVWDNLTDVIPHPYNLEDAKDFIEYISQESPIVTFGICDQAGQLCGIIGLVPKKDVYRKSAEIGYWLGEPHWGQGMMSEAVHKITVYGFEQLDLARIQAVVFAYNPASMRVLEKNGYTFEGIARKAVFKNEQLHDEHRYAILREEYEARQD